MQKLRDQLQRAELAQGDEEAKVRVLETHLKGTLEAQEREKERAATQLAQLAAAEREKELQAQQLAASRKECAALKGSTQEQLNALQQQVASLSMQPPPKSPAPSLASPPSMASLPRGTTKLPPSAPPAPLYSYSHCGEPQHPPA